MAVTVTEIRQGLADSLAVLTDVQVSPYRLANPTPPACHVYPGGASEIEYDLTQGRGLDRWPFTVEVFVGLNSDIGAQMLLDAFVAPSGGQSVKAAIEADPTLGGIVEQAHVVSCTGDRIYVVDATRAVLGASWSVEILAVGK